MDTTIIDHILSNWAFHVPCSAINGRSVIHFSYFSSNNNIRQDGKSIRWHVLKLYILLQIKHDTLLFHSIQLPWALKSTIYRYRDKIPIYINFHLLKPFLRAFSSHKYTQKHTVTLYPWTARYKIITCKTLTFILPHLIRSRRFLHLKVM